MSYVTDIATQKTDKKTSKMVDSLREIAYYHYEDHKRWALVRMVFNLSGEIQPNPKTICGIGTAISIDTMSFRRTFLFFR